MLILKEYNLALTFSRLAISTRPGIRFFKMLYSCTATSFSVGLLPSIEKSLPVALPSLTGPTLTCFSSCSTASIIAMLRRERRTDWRNDNTREVVGKPPAYKDGALPQNIVFPSSLLTVFCFKSYFRYGASHRG